MTTSTSCASARRSSAPWLAMDLISSYLSAEFSTDEDFRRRVEKLRAMDARRLSSGSARHDPGLRVVNIDLVVRVPRIPGPAETVLAPSYAAPGGKGANQAVRPRASPARPGRRDGRPRRRRRVRPAFSTTLRPTASRTELVVRSDDLRPAAPSSRSMPSARMRSRSPAAPIFAESGGCAGRAADLRRDARAADGSALRAVACARTAHAAGSAAGSSGIARRCRTVSVRRMPARCLPPAMS